MVWEHGKERGEWDRKAHFNKQSERQKEIEKRKTGRERERETCSRTLWSARMVLH